MNELNRELCQGTLINNTLTEVYTVPQNTTAIASCVHICNVTDNPAEFSLYFVPEGKIAENRYKYYSDVIVSSGGYFQNISPKTIPAGTKIVCISNKNEYLTVHISGLEIK